MSLAKETGHCGAVDPVSHCSCWHEPGHERRGVPHASMSGEHLWLDEAREIPPAAKERVSPRADAWGRAW